MSVNKNSRTNRKRRSRLVSSALLGDIVYRSNASGFWRMTDNGDESYDIYSWNGEGWSFSDNISLASAKKRLHDSWEVYARIVT